MTALSIVEAYSFAAKADVDAPSALGLPILPLTPKQLLQIPFKLMSVSKPFNERLLRQLLRTSSPQDSARLRSLSSGDGFAFLTTSLRHRDARLTPQAFRTVVLFYLGCITLPPHTKCPCGAPASADHLASCGMGQPNSIQSHDNVVHLLLQFFRDAQVIAQGARAPCTRFLCRQPPRPNAKRRMAVDIVSAGLQAGTMGIDVTVGNPLCPSNIAAAAKTTGATIKMREDHKYRVYPPHFYAPQDQLVPLAFELFATTSKITRSLLLSLAGKAASLPVLAVLGSSVSQRIFRYWTQRISVQFAKNNAAMIISRLPQLLRPRCIPNAWPLSRCAEDFGSGFWG